MSSFINNNRNNSKRNKKRKTCDEIEKEGDIVESEQNTTTNHKTKVHEKNTSSTTNYPTRKKRYFLRKYLRESIWKSANIETINDYVKQNEATMIPEEKRMLCEDLPQIFNVETNILHGGIATGYFFFVSKTPLYDCVRELLEKKNCEDQYASICFNTFVKYDCEENGKTVTKIRHFFKEEREITSICPYPTFDIIYKGIDYDAQEYRLFVNETMEPFYIDKKRPPLI